MAKNNKTTHFVQIKMIGDAIFTSTTKGEEGYFFIPFCLSVCLSVCLCTGYFKKLWTDPDPDEILWTGWVCDKDKLIRFW